MQTKQSAVKSLVLFGVCAAFALSALQLQAQDKKADPAGTWIWTMAGRNGGPDRTNTLVLKVEGEKLTGTISAPGGRGGAAPAPTAIEDGKIKGDEVSFTVTREFGGNKMVSKYSGKVSADAIKGKTETDRGDGSAPQPRDWEAKREAAKK